jgi:hypothetical protein
MISGRLSFFLGKARAFFEGRAGLIRPAPLQKKASNAAQGNTSAFPKKMTTLSRQEYPKEKQ